MRKYNLFRVIAAERATWTEDLLIPGIDAFPAEFFFQMLGKQAGLPNVRIHDLRHSFASFAAGLGQDLHMIGKLLGHSQAQTTHRYAHLADDPVKLANEKVGTFIQELMKPNSTPS